MTWYIQYMKQFYTLFIIKYKSNKKPIHELHKLIRAKTTCTYYMEAKKISEKIT